MKAPIGLSLSVIALAASLVSCAGSNTAPTAGPASTAPVATTKPETAGTPEPEPTVTTGSVDVSLDQIDAQALSHSGEHVHRAGSPRGFDRGWPCKACHSVRLQQA